MPGRTALAAVVAFVSLASGYAAWAQRPDRVVTQTAARPDAVWTPESDAPAGTLSHQLEAFIELQRGW